MANIKIDFYSFLSQSGTLRVVIRLDSFKSTRGRSFTDYMSGNDLIKFTRVLIKSYA